jgi:single-strand DNA-binding protein
MVNKVTLVGRLGQEPETKYTPSGAAVCKFSLATSEKFKDRAGARQERTEWHTVRVWGKLAEICQEYLRKGALVYVEGRIRYEEWEKNGEKRRATVIVCREMRMLGSKSNSRPAGEGSAYGSDAAERAAAPASQSGPAGPELGEITDEDVPF